MSNQKLLVKDRRYVGDTRNQLIEELEAKELEISRLKQGSRKKDRLIQELQNTNNAYYRDYIACFEAAASARLKAIREA